KGLTLPQKPSWVSTVNGALPVALSAAGAGVLGGVDAAGCWASAGSASRKAMNNATTARFFIFYILRWGAPDAPRCTPYAGVIAIWCVLTDDSKASLLRLPASADATLDRNSRRLRCQRLHLRISTAMPN